MAKPIEVRPPMGGMLITDASSDSVPIQHYLEKLDFRREQDREVRSEGHDYFAPIQSFAGTWEYVSQYFPGEDRDDKELIAELIRPNGERAIIAASKKKIWRFYADASVNVYDEGVYEIGVYEEYPGIWIEIGTGFSDAGKRWQWANINGWLVLNNGVDLPVSYRFEERVVQPLHELRELGIASVGFITEHNGRLICSDISYITEDDLPGVLELNDAYDKDTAARLKIGNPDTAIFPTGIGTVQDSGGQAVIKTTEPVNVPADFVGASVTFSNGRSTVVTGAGVDYGTYTEIPVQDLLTDVTSLQFWIYKNSFYEYEVYLGPGYTQAVQSPLAGQSGIGEYIVLDGRNNVRKISDLTSDKVVFDTFLPAFQDPTAKGFFSYTNPNTYSAYTGKTDRYSWRIIRSAEGDPRRFGAVHTGSITKNSVRLKLKERARSITAGMELIITGAGYGGGNLAAKVLWVEADYFVWLDTPARTTVTDGQVQALEAMSSLLGYTDLIQTGSPIVAMRNLRDTLVVYKDDSIFLGQWTGDASNPFPFVLVHEGHDVPRYENTVVSVTESGQDFHLYAGQGEFYRFDTVTRKPQLFGPLRMVRNEFFDKLITVDPWAAVNPITREIWLGGAERLIRYNYEQPSVSLSAIQPTCVGYVKRPMSDQRWFLMAIDDYIYRYGMIAWPKPTGIAGCYVSKHPSGSGHKIIFSKPILTDEYYGWSIIANGKAFPITNIDGPTDAVVLNTGDDFTGVPLDDMVPRIWHRNSQPYDSILASGLLKDRGFNELALDSYVLILGDTKTADPVSVDFIGGRNPTEAESWITAEITQPQTHNLLTLDFRQNYLGDKITVSGLNQPAEIAARIFDVRPIKTGSISRSGSSLAPDFGSESVTFGSESKAY